ncbi:MAG TPA: MFS transporter [Streptosporangiaceae bacterium]|nr:MFS transporter [Streptosporangiaceae bacterium]HLN69813.1 MFS transporter [Streptosporangiaceae bacterium]
MSRLESLRSGPLGVRSFRLLAGGQFTSTIGDYCYAVALPWLVLSNGGGAVLLGTVLACYGVPRTVLIPVGGVLADKVGPRTVMLAADAARCVLVAALAVLAARHTTSLAALGPIAAFIGAGEGLFIPASFAIMPSLLDGERLAAGNAISTAAVQAGSLVGPALGGALVAATRASTWAFAIDAASFAVSAATLALIPRRPAAGSVATGVTEAQDTADADAGGTAGGGDHGVLALLKRSRALQVILVVVVAANLVGGGADGIALPSLAHVRFGAAGYGALLACFAVGSVLGTLAAARTGGLRRPAIFASMAFLISATALAVTPYLGGEAGAAAALFVTGATNGLGNVTFLTVLQKQTPPALLGRVMGALMLCAFGSFPLSVAISGVLVRHIGPSLFFPVAGAVVAAAILGGLTQREFREFGAADGSRSDGASPASKGAGAEEPLASQRRAALSGLTSDERARREESA